MPTAFFAPKILAVPADFLLGVVIPIHVHHGVSPGTRGWTARPLARVAGFSLTQPLVAVGCWSIIVDYVPRSQQQNFIVC